MKLLLPLYVFTIALLKSYYMFNNDNTLHKVQHQHHHPGGISRVVDRFMTVMACERYGTRYPTWVISHVPMFHITQPWMVYGLLDGYYKVMSNIPKMGHLPTPVQNKLSWGNKIWECDYGDIKVQNGFRIQTGTLIDCRWFILMSSIASMQQTCSHSEASSGFIGTYSGWVHETSIRQSKAAIQISRSSINYW